MRTIHDTADARRNAPVRLIMLPAAFCMPADFMREGFARAVRARRLDIDLTFAGCNFRHVADRSVPRRLQRALIAPAHARGVRVWLGGISLGGYLALCCAERDPGSLEGLCLFAPYLGSHVVTGEIERAGGLRGWQPGLADEDEERRVWRFLKALSRPRRAASTPRFISASAVTIASRRATRYLRPRSHLQAWTVCPEGTTGRHGANSGRIFSTHGSAAVPEQADMADPPRRRPWRPSALIRGSMAWHCAAAAALATRPHAWPWVLSAVAADHLLLAAAGLWPRSALLGPNWTRLPPAAPARAVASTRTAARPPAVAITIDDGPDPEVTPRVLELLDERGARATFFCIGERVARHPALAREIVQHGHAVENHSHRHPMAFSLLGPRAMALEVNRAQEAISAATGEAPRFFRAPAGLRNPFLEPVLVRANLRLASWTRRGFDTVDARAGQVLRKLTRHLADGDILLLHDGHAARTAAGAAVILEVLPPLLAALTAAGLATMTLRAAASRAQEARAVPPDRAA